MTLKIINRYNKRDEIGADFSFTVYALSGIRRLIRKNIK